LPGVAGFSGLNRHRIPQLSPGQCGSPR
jgi:hypothetical protein